MKELSPKQKLIFEFMKRFAFKHGYGPTYRETAAHFSDNVGTVQVAVAGLLKKGYLEKSSGIARGLIIKEPHANRQITHAVPLYGSVSAGEPIFADSNLQGYVAYDGGPKSYSDLFCLKVKGDSMIDKGILDGDILFVRKQSDAGSGEIVIALLEDEATVKILRKEGARVYLKPANPAYKNIYREFEVIGKVISLKRDYNLV